MSTSNTPELSAPLFRSFGTMALCLLLKKIVDSFRAEFINFVLFVTRPKTYFVYFFC